MKDKDFDEIILNISSKFITEKFGNNINVEIDFTLKVNPEKIRNMQYLKMGSIGTIFQEHLVDRMLKYCSEDFETIAVTLVNLRKKSEPFEIKGFYALNVLKVKGSR